MIAGPMAPASSASGAVAQDTSPDTAGGGTASVQASVSHIAFDLPTIAAPETQEPARLIVGPPLPEYLARGLFVIQCRAENLRIVPVFGSAALEVKPCIGHIHVAVDDAGWHWADASGEQLIIQGVDPGLHSMGIDLANPTHRIIDSQAVHFEIPSRPAAR